MSRDDVTDEYAFDMRQTNYYTDAARYLGLVDKKYDGRKPIYSLSEFGHRLMKLNYKQRQLVYANVFLSTRCFSIYLLIVNAEVYQTETLSLEL